MVSNRVATRSPMPAPLAHSRAQPTAAARSESRVDTNSRSQNPTRSQQKSQPKTQARTQPKTQPRTQRGSANRGGGFQCNECGLLALKWMGQCEGCGQWNTLEEHVPASVISNRSSVVTPIGDVSIDPLPSVASGLDEFDRVVGGGLAVGSVTLIGGEPGIGKSTLLLQVLGSVAQRGHRALYVSAEESDSQVAQRARRLGLVHDNLLLLSETSVEHICDCIGSSGSSIVVIDSIQTVSTDTSSGAAGSVSQVRTCAQILVSYAKSRGITLLLVGHVTKDGSLAGPRLLEHLVDSVLSFEGDRYHSLRFLRAVKHRFGPTSEVGLMCMDADGLETLADPSTVFLADRTAGLAGSAVVPTVDGRRPLLVEVQALLVRKAGQHPRRSVQGLDAGRVELMLAVLQSRCELASADLDVFALAMGGARLTEPAADLGIALAVVSAMAAKPIPNDVVAIGEIGLSGEIRQVGDVARRLSEAARLGFGRALVPPGASIAAKGVEVCQVRTLGEAVRQARLL